LELKKTITAIHDFINNTF